MYEILTERVTNFIKPFWLIWFIYQRALYSDALSVIVKRGQINALEQCMADALVDKWLRRAAFNVEVVPLLWDVERVDIRMHQAVRGVSHSSHHTAEVHDKHAVSACFMHAAAGFSSWLGVLHVIPDVLDIVGDGLGLISLAACSADDEANVDILNRHSFFISGKQQKDSCGAAGIFSLVLRQMKDVVIYHAGEVGAGDALHTKHVVLQHKADVPIVQPFSPCQDPVWNCI